MPDVETVATLGVALSCVVAFAVVGTTLKSSVETNPDDAIDLDYDRIPIGQDRAREIKSRFTGEGGTGSSGGGSDDGDDPAEQSASSDPGSGEERTQGVVAAESGPTDLAPSRGETAGSAAQGTADSGTGSGSGGVPGRSLLDRLLALLWALLPYLVVALLIGVAYRYRERLLALLGLAGAVAAVGDDRAGGPEEWDPGDPPTPVHRAWLAMVRELDVEGPWSLTPGECRRAAVEAGMDPEAVGTLTTVFREVRYGEQPVTDERRERALRSADRITGGIDRIGAGSGGTGGGIDRIGGGTDRATDGGEPR